MENNQVKKKGKGLTIVSIIISVILLALCILLFTGVISSPFVKNDTNTTVKTTTKNDTKNNTTEVKKTTTDKKSTSEESTAVKETKKSDGTVVREIVKEKSADEKYKDYINNLSKSISNLDTDLRKIIKKRNGDFFRVELTKDKQLRFNFEFSNISGENFEIDNSVFCFFIEEIGDSDNYRVYYITTDGTLHSADIEDSVNSGSVVKRTEPFKNIVDVQNIGSTIFIDIDGNIYIK